MGTMTNFLVWIKCKDLDEFDIAFKEDTEEGLSELDVWNPKFEKLESMVYITL